MTQPDPQFEALVLYLKEARGFDFTGYKRASLERRIRRVIRRVRCIGKLGRRSEDVAVRVAGERRRPELRRVRIGIGCRRGLQAVDFIIAA